MSSNHLDNEFRDWVVSSNVKTKGTNIIPWDVKKQVIEWVNKDIVVEQPENSQSYKLEFDKDYKIAEK